MSGCKAFSFLRRASAATASLILSRLTENVDVIPSFFLFKNFVLLTFAQIIAEIPLLNFVVHFLASSCQSNPIQNVNLAVN